MCCVCRLQAGLPCVPFLGRLKGAHIFLIVFVVCYFIKVCFKMGVTVYAALCAACENTSMCGLHT